MGRVEGHVALVTGAASGQGAAEAELLAAEGAKVLVADVNDEAGRAVADRLDGAKYFHLDISDEGQWAAAVAAAQEHFGKLDILVNNAGIYRPKPMLETTREHWDMLVNVNQRGTFFGMQAAVPAIEAAGGGAIVNISSGAGMRGFPGMFAYGTTKWAVRGMSHHAAVELAAKNIRVNSVMPGLIDTPMLDEQPAGFQEALIPMIPLQRLGTPQDIAKAVLFLASDDASYITGIDLAVDGGGSA